MITYFLLRKKTFLASHREIGWHTLSITNFSETYFATGSRGVLFGRISREIANFTFFDPKKVAPSRDLPFKSRKNASNIQFFSQNAKNRPKYVSKMYFMRVFPAVLEIW